MSAALDGAGAWVRHVRACQRRFWYPYFGAGCWFVLSRLAVALPALDWGADADFEYRVAWRFACFHFYRRSESRLRSGGRSAGTYFLLYLASVGSAVQVVHHCGECS